MARDADASRSRPASSAADGGLPEREERRVPNYRFPEAAVRALAIAADRRDWLGAPPRPGRTVPDGFDAAAAHAVVAEAGEGWLDGDARDAAAARRRAWSSDAAPARRRDGVAVLVGAVNDPEFGPVVGVGTGGGRGWAGLIPGDVAFRLAPLTDVDAEEARQRARPPCAPRWQAGAHDAAALRDVVLRVGALADAVPELAEAELDPVRVGVRRRRPRRRAHPARRAGRALAPKTW